ncbi:hypothetical protein [Pelagicoccus sp. SDUM812003]|uniref:hypothetical protein n=1 Tax=Pelagicoccus sp. SDUM812003 TaxID=3041267 RepID=UPI00280E3DD7|nr:hypothetical protein [Pelagicoccus sp. SDUM812003]MDQ8202247.1 hypothetical protein [Pelagicoccus sp. SDUM812003]
MLKHPLRLASLFAIGLNVLSLSLAEPLSVGSPMPQLQAEDQHEKPYGISQDTRYVLVSFDMGPGKQANKYLDEKGADFLPENDAVYVANIHGMPGLIASTFALPKMRKYAHRILVMDEDGLFDDWPQEKGKVTVFTLDEAGNISSIGYWDPKDDAAPF